MIMAAASPLTAAGTLISPAILPLMTSRQKIQYKNLMLAMTMHLMHLLPKSMQLDRHWFTPHIWEGVEVILATASPLMAAGTLISPAILPLITSRQKIQYKHSMLVRMMHLLPKSMQLDRHWFIPHIWEGVEVILATASPLTAAGTLISPAILPLITSRQKIQYKHRTKGGILTLLWQLLTPLTRSSNRLTIQISPRLPTRDSWRSLGSSCRIP